MAVIIYIPRKAIDWWSCLSICTRVYNWRLPPEGGTAIFWIEEIVANRRELSLLCQNYLINTINSSSNKLIDYIHPYLYTVLYIQ